MIELPMVVQKRQHVLPLLAAIYLALAALTCTNASPRATMLASNSARTTFSDPVDFIGVSFKAGNPLQPHDTLRDTLTSSLDEEALEKDLELLKRTPPDIPLRIVGFTDSRSA
ncbi:hypothetical protein [Lysobacter gummosus]|uniref:hypothetical protein n=1 Tax=Lysobacter gummosus TaxID=262324 RepID=UPI00363C662C